jgi:hypothetical protein
MMTTPNDALRRIKHVAEAAALKARGLPEAEAANHATDALDAIAKLATKDEPAAVSSLREWAQDIGELPEPSLEDLLKIEEGDA